MAAPFTDICTPWATIDDLCPPCEDNYDSIPLGLLEDMLMVASNWLFRLSGHRFPGSCSDCVRPCSQTTSLDPVPNRSIGHHSVLGFSACACPGPKVCGCKPIPQLSLGTYPLTAIDEVKIDGVVLDSSSYRIDDYRWLVRTDGEGWPCCADPLASEDAEGAFVVRFTYGTPPDAGGIRAAAVLACELALACTPDAPGECRLPKRVQSITRQGVSMVLLDPMEFLQGGRTGLYEVDGWLATVNRHGLVREAGVYSPDIGPRVRRVTG